MKTLKLIDVANYLGLKCAKSFENRSIDDLVSLCGHLPADDEGFVVRFDTGYRVKIKGEEYLRLHRLISNILPTNVWEALINGDDLNTIRVQLPEEHLRDFNNIVSILFVGYFQNSA